MNKLQCYEIVELMHAERVYHVSAESHDHALELHNANKSRYINTGLYDPYDTEINEADNE